MASNATSTPKSSGLTKSAEEQLDSAFDQLVKETRDKLASSRLRKVMTEQSN
jgi:Ca2+-binding EF-hand superfamily protein